MLLTHKVVPFDRSVHGDMRSGCKGFATPQPHKDPPSNRPVFEPGFNSRIDRTALPALAYPSRLERRVAIAACAFFQDSDFKKYYDELALALALLGYFVIRTKSPVLDPITGITTNVFVLTRAPMGATFSAHVAQCCTAAIAEPIIQRGPNPPVFVPTMIDNVGIAARTAAEFCTAVRTFEARSLAAGATIGNPAPASDSDLIAEGLRTASSPCVFLGEEYVTRDDGVRCVRNQAKHVDRLRAAFLRLKTFVQARANQQAHTAEVITRRQVAALLGLANWMAHSLALPACRSFDVLRLFAALWAQADWDAEAAISPAMLSRLGEFIAPTPDNVPVPPVMPPPIRGCEADYDAIAVVDASARGFGAVIRTRTAAGWQSWTAQAGWSSPMRHSAWAEPEAVKCVIALIRRKFGPSTRIAIVTDHAAIPSGQTRPWSGTGGASTAFFLNRAYAEAYAPLTHPPHFYYVPGESNIADPLSRSVAVGKPLRVVHASDIMLPPLPSLSTGLLRKARRWWHV
jgi:hypothetical protein